MRQKRGQGWQASADRMSEVSTSEARAAEVRAGGVTGVPLRVRYGGYLRAFALVALCLVLAALLESSLPPASLLLLFIAGVLLVAVRTSIGPALVSAVVSALVFNFFFTDPHYTFFMSRREDVLTVGIFLAVALAGGRLANRLREQLLDLRASNAQTQAIAEFGRCLSAAPDQAAVYRETAATLARLGGVPVVVLAGPAGGDNDAGAGAAALRTVAVSPPGTRLEDGTHAAVRAAWVGTGVELDPQRDIAGWHFVALGPSNERLGVVGLRSPGGLPARYPLIQALVIHAALALARTRLAERLEKAKLAEETERLRSALLSSVSHDLRTPLSSMIGAASTLRTLDQALSPEERAELLDAVLSEGERLDRYIQNLLDMTRLGHGTLTLARDWVSVADVVDAALRRTRSLLSGCRVLRQVPDDLPLLYVHPALIEQALVNVLENAARFSPPGAAVSVEASSVDGMLRLAVCDEGPGIPPELRDKVFDMFFSGGSGDRGKHGSGLGLAICAGMVGAHGGRVEAIAGHDGVGAAIVMWLPLVAPPGGEP